MRECGLTAAGVDLGLKDKADVVTLLAVEIAEGQIGRLHDIRDGLIIVRMGDVILQAHRACRFTLGDEGKNTLKLEIVESLPPETILGLRDLQRQAHAVEVAAAVAQLGDNADKEDVAEVIDGIMRFDVSVTAAQMKDVDISDETAGAILGMAPGEETGTDE